MTALVMEPSRGPTPMTPNMTLANLPSPSPEHASSLKRKTIDLTDIPSSPIRTDDKENSRVEKKPRTVNADAQPLVEVQGRRLVFAQPSLPKTIPKRRQLQFEGFLLDAEESGQKIKTIPQEHWSLVAICGHEATSSTEAAFVKYLRTSLATKQQQDLIDPEALSVVIPQLFTFRNYGFRLEDFPSSSSKKLPVALQIPRWEVIDLAAHFPADQLDLLRTRQAARQRAREECIRVLTNMDDVERIELLKGDKEKTAAKEKPNGADDVSVAPQSSQPAEREDTPRSRREGTAATTVSRRSMSPQRKKFSPEEEEARRVKLEEREARKAAQAEKKAAKEEEQRRKEEAARKKEQSRSKQVNLMSSFLKKAAPTPAPLSRASPVAGPSSRPASTDGSPVKQVKPTYSDFQQTFRPIQAKANVEWAPTNIWATDRRNSGEAVDASKTATSSPSSWSPKDFLADHLRRHGMSPGKRRRSRLPKGLKSGPLYGTVGDAWTAYQNAADPRKILNQLRDKSRFPWKTLAFDQQTRPPYSGTFTKKSLVVGPRTPFAQDPIFDYSYDSGDEWQDDEGGEDVDEPAEDVEMDSDDGEDEGEFDDWLDDSEDTGYAPVAVDDYPVEGPKFDQSLLPMKVVKKSRDVPKKVVKITPYWRGPEWESKLGAGTEGMEPYRMQLLNETPDSFDPFVYASEEPAQAFTASYTTVAIGPCLSVRCLLSSEPLATATKPKPEPEVPLAGPSEPIASASTVKRPAVKVAFPETHLAELFRLVEGDTRIQGDLVSYLKAHFGDLTTKSAIKQKLEEATVREGKGKEKRWKVRQEAWVAAGLEPRIETALQISS